MGNLLLKAGLLLPFILSTVEKMTNTIRRQPYLLVEDSINFMDVQGRKYTMHYEYFKHWSVSTVTSSLFCHSFNVSRNADKGLEF
jgi:hypothetical protein